MDMNILSIIENEFWVHLVGFTIVGSRVSEFRASWNLETLLSDSILSSNATIVENPFNAIDLLMFIF